MYARLQITFHCLSRGSTTLSVPAVLLRNECLAAADDERGNFSLGIFHLITLYCLQQSAEKNLRGKIKGCQPRLHRERSKNSAVM